MIPKERQQLVYHFARAIADLQAAQCFHRGDLSSIIIVAAKKGQQLVHRGASLVADCQLADGLGRVPSVPVVQEGSSLSMTSPHPAASPYIGKGYDRSLSHPKGGCVPAAV